MSESRLRRVLAPMIQRASPDLKRNLKKTARQIVKSWDRCFYSFTSEDFLKALRRLGVREGDVLCVHSSFKRLIAFQGGGENALRVLKRAVGDSGGLMMPNQPMSGTALEYIGTGNITTPDTPSAMGILTELLRRAPGSVRTIHPTHPVALWGQRGSAMIGQDWRAGTPCGRGTAYYRLLEEDGSVLMLGTGFRPVTFYHCVEELIEPDLPFSPFTQEIYEAKCRDAAGETCVARMRLNAPELAPRSIPFMVPFLKSAGRWREIRVGKTDLILVRANDILVTAREMARAGQYCYYPEKLKALGVFAR